MKYIDLHTSKSEIQDYLSQKGWLQSKHEKILSIEKPGEGNMNVVLRIRTNERSFIIKQSRPFVQKYQQIEAPIDRIDVEYQFYDAINSEELKSYIPQILAYDKTEYLLAMEDLGQCEDMASIYSSNQIEDTDIDTLVRFLEIIHGKAVSSDYPQNMDLRQLNHQHIFVLPFKEDNGFDLNDIQEGLQSLSLIYKKDEALKSLVENIGKQYLSRGTTLLHGDYYPGSWMKSGDGLFIIDPEFSFLGFAEFDLGVMTAHLILASLDDGYLPTICNKYERSIDQNLVSQIAGIEIMRRLIGLAQLPLKRSLEEKDYLLQIARRMLFL